MAKFIVIEGTDGSGKATQTAMICKLLEEKGLPYKKLTFPRYDNPSSTLLRMYLGGEFGSDPNAVNPYAASTFFTVDRYASFKTEWKDFYEAGGIVVADRYTTSNAVHQASKLEGEARDAYLQWLFDFEYNLMGLPAPDKVIFLDMPSELTFRLIQKRQGDTGDIHEQDHAYLEKCRANALDVCEKFGWTHIYCGENGEVKSIEQIHREIMAEIGEVLGLE